MERNVQVPTSNSLKALHGKVFYLLTQKEDFSYQDRMKISLDVKEKVSFHIKDTER